MAFKIKIYNGDKFVKEFIKETKEEAEQSVKVCKIMTELPGTEDFFAVYEEISD